MTRRVDIEKKIFVKNFRPVRRDGVLVLFDEIPSEIKYHSKDKTKGESHLLMSGKAVQSRVDRVGTVISVGQDVKELQSGSRILLNRCFGIAINHDDDLVCQLKYVSLDQVDAVFEGDEATEEYDYYQELFW